MIKPGVKVIAKGHGNNHGIVLSIKDNFAEINMDSRILWKPIDDLIDISDEQVDKIIRGQFDKILDFILAVDAHRLLNEYKFNPYVLASSTKITIFPHQIEEVTWGLENSRIMIADEVGLGKTIIAALIASELKSRGLADKILYVVPKSLVLKWQDELSGRFDTNTKILDAEYIRQNKEPFLEDTYDYITSMDFLKRKTNLELLKGRIDLVVVDEAHKFKINTERLELGKVLSANSDAMIMLTATPHDGRDDDFMVRMKLLDPFVPDTPSSTYLWRRHIKENVVNMDGEEVFPERHSKTVDIKLTNAEREINILLDNYIKNRYEEATASQVGTVRFLSTIFKKRAASSTEALRNTLTNRLNKLGRITDEELLKNTQTKLNYTEDENDADYEDVIGDAESIIIGRGDIEKEKQDLIQILDKIEELKGKDSKFDELLKWIKKIKTEHHTAKILLFTEYRDTLEYLSGRFLEHYTIGRIDGTMSIQERKASLEEFSKKNGPELLLCTDAAGEGIDMQFCNVEFNYDIPWNPNKLEQRMGRIHRIGQKRNVYYYNIVVDKDESIDGTIFDILLNKIDRIKDAIGDAIFDVLGMLINSDIIAKLYEELLTVPKSEWNAKVTIELEKISEKRDEIMAQTQQLLEGHKLDHTVLENIRKIKRDAVDSGEIKRFLMIWSEFKDGSFEYKDSKTQFARIIPPHEIGLELGIIDGTFDGEIAQEKNWNYLALGNKKIQMILTNVAKLKPVTTLSHPTKSGLICVYQISTIDGKGRMRNSKIVGIFHNEDGKVTEFDPRSLWSYNEGTAPPNTKLLIDSKKRIDNKLNEIKKSFHENNMVQLNTVKEKTKEIMTKHIVNEIDIYDKKIKDYESRKNTSPGISLLIEEQERKKRSLIADMEKREKGIEYDFKCHAVTELIAMATVIPESNANERRRVELKGMEIVIKYEMERPNAEQNKIRDVSERDTGFDIESFDRHIEVKSFKTTGTPKLTSHEWATADRMGDDYWLYVVEDVFDDNKSIQERVTVIQNPYVRFLNSVKRIETVTSSYVIEDWKNIASQKYPLLPEAQTSSG